MPGSISHIKTWIDHSEADYYTMFIKTWIPFNAWYMTNYYDEDAHITSDKDIIGKVMSESNPYRDRIISLIKGTNDEAVQFRRRLAQLHLSLENHLIPNAEEYISFTQVCISDNPDAKKTIQEKVGRVTCKVRFDETLPRTSNRWILEVVTNKSGITQHMIQLKRCSQHELSCNPDFKSIEDGAIKGKLQKCLNMISPSMTTDVTIPALERDGIKKQPRNCIVIDSACHVYFCNNMEWVASAIVKVIYELRCKLFHGEVEPTVPNMEVYEHAYHLQRMLIKNLVSI